MPALTKTLTFIQSYDSNKNPIKSTTITFPPASYMPVTNTDPITYYSEKEMGDGYYGGLGVHTVTYIPWIEQSASKFTVNNFRGVIVMQATLATTPTESDWFDIEETAVEYTDTFHDNVFYNFTGNYVWIRAKVLVSGGVLQAIHYNH
jgi:hypothetical protein